ncbi:GNAT family N-acetyltransferase [Candidatus Saccharibacteria bacterium oral taxon 955]|nr:GNAT family N-acetyltransferase [Candidatus Saccharibacteria bacterium oral taxon 955]
MIEYDAIVFGSDRSEGDVERFISLYKEAFGGPPYFEAYSNLEVLRGVWDPHIEHGVIVLAKENGDSVIGFCCAVPVRNAPDDVRAFLRDSQEIPVDSNQTWYISELGVALSHRNRGVAYAMTEMCLSEASNLGGVHYVMRTASEGSNSRHMFLRMGYLEALGAQDVSAQAEKSHSQSSHRIWLYGRCSYALQNLRALSTP